MKTTPKSEKSEFKRAYDNWLERRVSFKTIWAVGLYFFNAGRRAERRKKKVKRDPTFTMKKSEWDSLTPKGKWAICEMVKSSAQSVPAIWPENRRKKIKAKGKA